MKTLSMILVGLVALEHAYIMVLEMFMWTTNKGRRTFGFTREFAESTKTLGANQGLYNGFLAAGLLWSMLHPDPAMAYQLQLFFLGCVLVAGIYGGITAFRKILFIQGVPAALALAVVLFVHAG